MSLALSAYRFGEDRGAENTHPFYAAVNTAVNFGQNKTGVFLVRLLVQATGAGQSNCDFQLRYKLNSGSFTNVTTTSSVIRAVAGAATTDAGNTTSRLGGTGTFESSSAGVSEDGVCGGTAFDIVSDGNGECLFAVAMQTADTAPGDVITFDLLVDGATFTMSVVPTINVVAAPVEIVRTIIPGGGGDYTTLGAFESGEQRDLVAQDELAVGECQSGAQSTGQVRFAGYTTDTTHYPWIRAAAGHEHGGLASGGFSITNNTSGHTILPPFNHSRIEGIVVANSSTGMCFEWDANSNGMTSWVVGCVMPDGNRGISRAAGTATITVANCIIYGQTAECVLQNAASSTLHAYNNTLIGGTYGLRQVNGTLRAKNNIAQGNSTACYGGTLTDDVTNLASDATGNIQATLTFVNAAGNDYHLHSSDTAAIDAGTDLSADGDFAFDYDIDGEERPQGSAWDIGADESVATAVEASGAQNTPAVTGVGTAAIEAAATGSASTAAVTGTGDAAVDVDASGAPSIAGATATGAASVDTGEASASGSPSISAATASGSVAAHAAASGSPTTAAATAAGSVDAHAAATGAGTAPAADASGSVDAHAAASGAPEVAAATATGDATAAVSAAGTPSIAAATAAGSADVLVEASGAATIAAVDGSGFAATEEQIFASGAPATAAATATGTATAEIGATGTPAIAPATGAGDATAEIGAVGAPSIAPVTATGDATVLVEASGAPNTAAVVGDGSAGLEAQAGGAGTSPAVTGTGLAFAGELADFTPRQHFVVTAGSQSFPETLSTPIQHFVVTSGSQSFLPATFAKWQDFDVEFAPSNTFEVAA